MENLQVRLSHGRDRGDILSTVKKIYNMPNQFGDELKTLRELYEKGNRRTTFGTINYLSPTSGFTYTSTQGEAGLFVVLRNALDSYLVNDASWGSIQDAIDTIGEKDVTYSLFEGIVLDSGMEIVGNTLKLKNEEVIDRTTPVQVVNSAYTTSASARPQRLSNGWIVTATKNASLYLVLNVSKDNGATFTQLCTTSATMEYGFSITSYGTIVTIIYGTTLGVGCVKFDATTVTNTPQSQTSVIDSGQTSGSVTVGSIAVNPSNGHLTATWSSKNATYPNSFNIRSAKSVDGGVTWTKQDGTAGVDQISTNNTSGFDYISPVIVYVPTGLPTDVPLIVFNRTLSSNPAILLYRWTGSAWSSTINIYEANGAYSQSNPTATVDSTGVIHVAWDGLDATDNAATNIRYSKSTDNGATWSAMLKLTTGNTATQNKPSITCDLSNNIYVMFIGTVSSNFQVRQIKYSGSWGVITNVTLDAVDKSGVSTCDNYKNFENPIAIWKTPTDVKFYGKWTVGTQALTGVSTKLLSPLRLTQYEQIFFSRVAYEQSQVCRVDIYNSDGSTLLLSDVYSNQFLNSINPSTYPSIMLKYTLTRASGQLSPTISNATMKVITDQSTNIDTINNYRVGGTNTVFTADATTNTYKVQMNGSTNPLWNTNITDGSALKFVPTNDNTKSIVYINIPNNGTDIPYPVKKWDVGTNTYVNPAIGDIKKNNLMTFRWVSANSIWTL